MHKCNPVCGPGEQMWLLVDDDGPELVGCVRFEVSADGAEAFVKVLAVALDYRGMGVADILMQVVIDEVTTLAVQQPSIRRQSVVTAHVDKRNLRSRALASRQGLRNVGTVNGYELWQLIVDIEAVPEPAG